MTISAAASEILESRGLDIETLYRLGVKSVDRRPGEWIGIPYYLDNGEQAVNVKYRRLDEKQFAQEKDATKCLWNQSVLGDDTLASQPLIVTEGEFDAIAAIQAGFPRAVSVPNGAPAQPQGQYDRSKFYDFLPPVMDRIDAVESVIIAADKDDKGANLLNDLALWFGPEKCKWVDYPDGCKDLGEVLERDGPTGVTEVINGAKWFDLGGVYSLDELPPRQPQVAYKCGIPVFEDMYRIRLGDFVVVTGIPGHGKTSLLTELAARMAQDYGWKAAFYSPEQPPRPDHVRNLRTWYARKPEWQMTEEEIACADRFISKHFLFVYAADDQEVTPRWLMTRLKVAIVRHGVSMICIDPFNQIEDIGTDVDDPSVRMQFEQYTDWVGRTLKSFQNFARRHNVHLVMAAHPFKMAPDRDGKSGPPSLYSISGSAHFANKADLGVVVYRGETETSLRVTKVRYCGVHGRPGEVKATFSPTTNRYTVIDQ